MKIYKVTLFGHRDLNAHSTVEKRLYPIIRDLIQTESYIEFYIGRNGEFDIFAASVLKRIQKTLEIKTVQLYSSFRTSKRILSITSSTMMA